MPRSRSRRGAGAARSRGRGRRARRARPRPRTRRVASAAACVSGASRSGSRTDAITTACRRASTGTASSSERAAASSTRSVHTTISARLTPPTARNARSWSLSTSVGSTSRIVRTTALPPARRGREPAADLGVVHGHAAAVAELVGDERDHRDRVDRGVEPGDRVAPRPPAIDRVDERRGHQPAGVEQAHDVAVLLDAVLVAHRPADARGGLPVDLADVVVGEVVAHRLELGAEPERPARAQPGIAEAAAAHRDHEPLRREHVRGTRGGRCRRRRRRCTCRGRAGRAAGPRPAGGGARRAGARRRSASSRPHAGRAARS